MHNYRINPSITPDEAYRNQLAIEDAVNSTAYNYWIPAKDFDLQQSTYVPTFYAAARSWAGEPAHWELGKLGGTHGVTAYIRRMPGWKDGYLIARAHVGVDTIGGNVVYGVSFNPLVSAVVYGATYSTMTRSVNASINTIETRNLWLDTSGGITNTYCMISPANIGAILRIQRRPTNGSDTATGDVRLYGVEICYVEGNRNIGGQFTPNKRQFS